MPTSIMIVSCTHLDFIIEFHALARDNMLFHVGLLLLFEGISLLFVLLVLEITLLIGAPVLSVDPLLIALLLRITVLVLCVVLTLCSSSLIILSCSDGRVGVVGNLLCKFACSLVASLCSEILLFSIN